MFKTGFETIDLGISKGLNSGDVFVLTAHEEIKPIEEMVIAKIRGLNKNVKILELEFKDKGDEYISYKRVAGKEFIVIVKYYYNKDSDKTFQMSMIGNMPLALEKEADCVLHLIKDDEENTYKLKTLKVRDGKIDEATFRNNSGKIDELL